MTIQLVSQVAAASAVGRESSQLKTSTENTIRFYFLENKEKQSNAKEIAQSLFDDINRLGTGSGFEDNLKKLNKDNIIEVLEQYKNISASNNKKESLIGAIYNEMWLSRSTPKRYSEMIFKQLELKSDELGIDNKVLKEKQQAELTSLSDSIKVNFGVGDSSKLEFFADEMVRRLNIREKLNSANEHKFRNSQGNIKPDEYAYEYVRGIISTHGVSTSDILGNGKLDNEIKQVNYNCWAIAGINSFLENDELKEVINNLIVKKDGIISVYLPEAGQVYSFTEKEIVEGTRKAYCIGDGDAVAVLMAVDKYFKSTGNEDYTDSRLGSLSASKMLEILTGLPNNDKFWRFEDMQPKNIYSTKDISTFGVKKFIESIQNGEPYAGVFCFYGGVEAERVNVSDKNKTIEEMELSSLHTYTIHSSDENYVYLKDSNYPNNYLRIPHSSLQYVLDAAIYKYR